MVTTNKTLAAYLKAKSDFETIDRERQGWRKEIAVARAEFSAVLAAPRGVNDNNEPNRISAEIDALEAKIEASNYKWNKALDILEKAERKAKRFI